MLRIASESFSFRLLPTPSVSFERLRIPSDSCSGEDLPAGRRHLALGDPLHPKGARSNQKPSESPISLALGRFSSPPTSPELARISTELACISRASPPRKVIASGARSPHQGSSFEYDVGDNRLSADALYDALEAVDVEGNVLTASIAGADGQRGPREAERPDGLVEGHAFSILQLATVGAFRLVQLRNPCAISDCARLLECA